MQPEITVTRVTADGEIPALVVRALDELFSAGIGPDYDLPWHWSDQAVIAKVDGVLVGLISFRHEEKQPTLSVLLGYVRPAFRRTGIYRLLWEKLIEHARKNGAVRIWGGTHVDNLPMLAFYKKHQRTVTHVTSYFTIPPETTHP